MEGSDADANKQAPAPPPAESTALVESLAAVRKQLEQNQQAFEELIKTAKSRIGSGERLQLLQALVRSQALEALTEQYNHELTARRLFMQTVVRQGQLSPKLLAAARSTEAWHTEQAPAMDFHAKMSRVDMGASLAVPSFAQLLDQNLLSAEEATSSQNLGELVRRFANRSPTVMRSPTMLRGGDAVKAAENSAAAVSSTAAGITAADMSLVADMSSAAVQNSRLPFKLQPRLPPLEAVLAARFEPPADGARTPNERASEDSRSTTPLASSTASLRVSLVPPPSSRRVTPGRSPPARPLGGSLRAAGGAPRRLGAQATDGQPATSIQPPVIVSGRSVGVLQRQPRLLPQRGYAYGAEPMRLSTTARSSLMQGARVNLPPSSRSCSLAQSSHKGLEAVPGHRGISTVAPGTRLSGVRVWPVAAEKKHRRDRRDHSLRRTELAGASIPGDLKHM